MFRNRVYGGKVLMVLLDKTLRYAMTRHHGCPSWTSYHPTDNVTPIKAFPVQVRFLVSLFSIIQFPLPHIFHSKAISRETSCKHRQNNNS